MQNLRTMDKVFFINVFCEVEKTTLAALGETARELRNVGNLFTSLTDAKTAQRVVLGVLKSLQK